MLLLAIIIFVLAAMGGLFLLSYILTDKNTPKGLAIIHGALGALGIILLIIYSFFYPSPWLSIILLILAALGGVYLFLKDIVGVKPSKLIAIGHGLGAIIALLTLAYFAWRAYSGL